MVFDPNKAGKSLCACGALADTFGGLCDRCASLQALGLATHATPEDVEGAYLTLVKVWHPDRFAHDPRLRMDAEEKLKEINAAHDFLLTHPKPEPPRPAPLPEKPAIFERSEPSPAIELEGEETDEVRKILRRRQKSNAPAILLKFGFTLGAVAIIALVWLTGDSFLSTNSVTSRSWDQLKAEVKHDMAVHFESSSSSQAQQPAAAPAPPPSAPDLTSAPAPVAKQVVSHDKPREQVRGPKPGPKPYLTAGLTPMEVLTALGQPTSSTGEKMFYGNSEIDFKNGQVSGWKLDPASPLRVKLWSDSPSAPGLTTFGVGSTKSDVIALQGTPTLFSDNEFGYNNSRIYFQNNRVVSWKQDPSSVPLRVAR